MFWKTREFERFAPATLALIALILAYIPFA
jgi:hypothetical protein